jgi:hypothetical protein
MRNLDPFFTEVRASSKKASEGGDVTVEIVEAGEFAISI